MNAILTGLALPFARVRRRLLNEVWRASGRSLHAGLNEDSEIVGSVTGGRTRLAGVIAKLVLFPTGALATVSLPVRVIASIFGFVIFLAVRRSVSAGVLAAEAALLIGGFLFVP